MSNVWQPIETAPIGKEMILVVGVTSGIDTTAFKPYTTDMYCVWQPKEREFTRWPHSFGPTHWMPLPSPPENTR